MEKNCIDGITNVTKYGEDTPIVFCYDKKIITVFIQSKNSLDNCFKLRISNNVNV